jgi:hypothetical protein
MSTHKDGRQYAMYHFLVSDNHSPDLTANLAITTSKLIRLLLHRLDQVTHD